MENFDALQVRKDCVDWLKEYGIRSGLKKVVIGISGGKDSTVAAALCCEAFGKENVTGLLLPNGEQSDFIDALNVCDSLGISSKTYNIHSIFNTISLTFEIEGQYISPEALINVGPRIRMMILYAFAQTNGCRVCGTGNLSEATLGYFTKWGDGAYDFNPLANLTTLEVVAIGKTYKNIPIRLIEKIPSDGLCGMFDEEKLGVSYKAIHNYIRLDGTITRKELDKIVAWKEKGSHKLQKIPCFPYKPELKWNLEIEE